MSNEIEAVEGTDVTLTIPPEIMEMIERECGGSNRSVHDHLLHMLAVRYRSLLRICACGYFIYDKGNDVTCHWCGKGCCAFDSIPFDYRDMCFDCAKERDIDTDGRGGFRAAPERKI